MVVIPALNEEEALPAVLRQLRLAPVRAVVVADNGSSDGTAQVARAAGAVVVREDERGYGAACLAALKWIASQPGGPPWAVVFTDADSPGDVARMEVLLDALKDGAELALGVRVAPGGDTGNRHAHARWGGRLVLTTARLLFGCRFRDLPPFRAIRYDALLHLQMDDRNWGWTLQMQLRAARAGLVIREAEVPHERRSLGQSKVSGRLWVSVRVGVKMIYTLMRERCRRTHPFIRDRSKGRSAE